MRKLTVLTLCHLMIGKSIGHSRSRVKPCAGRVRERCRSHLCHLQRARRESPVARVCHPGPGRRSWGRLARPSSTGKPGRTALYHPGPGRRSWGRLARPSSTSSARSDRPAHPGSPQAYRARDGPRRCCRRDERVHRRPQGDVRPRPAWRSGSCGARHPAPPRRQLNSRRGSFPQALWHRFQKSVESAHAGRPSLAINSYSLSTA